MRRALHPSARVLVRMPSWLGDFVVAEPVVRALHARFEQDGRANNLSIAGPERFQTLFDGRFKGARRIVGDEPDAWRDHDVALLLNGSWRSVWTAFRAGIPERAGFARGGRSALLTLGMAPARERGKTPLGLGIHGRVPRALPRPFGVACVELAASLGLEVRERTPRLEPAAPSLDAMRSHLAERGVRADFVLLHAGGRPRSAKAFPAESWRAVIDEIARSADIPIVIACAAGEEANAREAAERKSATLLDDPPPDLPAIVALTALASVVVTADSGPRHLARALDVPCVVVCGPTDPRHTAEYEGDVRVLRVEVPCGPCHREICPLVGEANHACMRRIDARTVAHAVLELLAAGRHV